MTLLQVTVLFENSAHISIPHETKIQQHSAGFHLIIDLVDFEDLIYEISDNLRNSGGRVPDLVSRDVARPYAPAPSVTFRAKYQVQIIVACHVVRFYEEVDGK